MSQIILTVVGVNGKAITSATKVFNTDLITAASTYVPGNNTSGITGANTVVSYLESDKQYKSGAYPGSVTYATKRAKSLTRPRLYYVTEAVGLVTGGYSLKEVIVHTWAGGAATTDTATALEAVATTDVILAKQTDGATALSVKGVRASASTITLTTTANAANGYIFQIFVYSKD